MVKDGRKEEGRGLNSDDTPLEGAQHAPYSRLVVYVTT